MYEEYARSWRDFPMSLRSWPTLPCGRYYPTVPRGSCPTSLTPWTDKSGDAKPLPKSVRKDEHAGWGRSRDEKSRLLRPPQLGKMYEKTCAETSHGRIKRGIEYLPSEHTVQCLLGAVEIGEQCCLLTM